MVAHGSAGHGDREAAPAAAEGHVVPRKAVPSQVSSAAGKHQAAGRGGYPGCSPCTSKRIARGRVQ